MLCAADLASILSPSVEEAHGGVSNEEAWTTIGGGGEDCGDEEHDEDDDEYEDEEHEEQGEHEEDDDAPATCCGAAAGVPAATPAQQPAAVAHACSSGHMKTMTTVEPWAMAALRALNKTKDDLVVVDTLDPNIPVAADLHHKIAEWQITKTTRKDAGVESKTKWLSTKPPPSQLLSRIRSWMILCVNERRLERQLPELDPKWVNTLPGGKADVHNVASAIRADKMQSGNMFHSRKDLVVSEDQLIEVMAIGFEGSARIHSDLLSAVETGMANAIYFPTGARGDELKSMTLQSLGYCEIQHSNSGLRFESMKMTAYHTKTKEYHMNQFLPHCHPWRCGVGLFGLSLMIRMLEPATYGPLPTTMGVNERSWKVFGSHTGSLDRRLKTALEHVGIERASNDPLTILGRHVGTRLLQHAGGSTEGGAARRGHTNGSASYSYTETPLDDMLLIAGNKKQTPWMPAHHNPRLVQLANSTVRLLVPEVCVALDGVNARLAEINRMRTEKKDVVRASEQILDRQSMLRAIMFACRMAVLDIVARPRQWEKWSIVANAKTMFERAVHPEMRAVRYLFQKGKNNEAALHSMNALAAEVRKCEDEEIAAREVCPEQAVANSVATAIHDMHEQQRQMFAALLASLKTTTTTTGSGDGGGGTTTSSHADESRGGDGGGGGGGDNGGGDDAGGGGGDKVGSRRRGRIKYARTQQQDVVYISTWREVGAALQYATEVLAPQEARLGATWRIRFLGLDMDGKRREDKSRDKQWNQYRTLALAVGVEDSPSAVERLQARFEIEQWSSLATFVKQLRSELKDTRHSDVIIRRVLQI